MSASYETTPTIGENAVTGRIPGLWVGTEVLNGAVKDWIGCPVGMEYMYKPNETTAPVIYKKLKDDGRTDDWSVSTGGSGVLAARFEIGDMTDGGATTGTYVVPTQTIPAGAFVVRAVLENVTGFTGDSSATIQVGDGTTVDRYSTGTPSVFTTAAAIDLGAVSGTAIHIAAKSVTVTITSGSDFAAVTAGAATLRIYYYK